MATHPRRGASSILTACCLLTVGCTMCPDPFDYSGPVPNGSAPQNDFMARSNGILPLRARPTPWPPIVDAEAPAGGETTVAGEEAEPSERIATGDEGTIAK